MIKRLKFVGVLLVGAFALGQAGQIHAADANPPEQMTYQGYLVDANGNPLGSVEDPSDPTGRASAPANYDVVFRVYKTKQGGLAIWGEQQTVTVDKGYFSVLLGEGVSIEAAGNINTLSDAFKGVDISDRFIGITVSGLGGGVDVEIAPRLRLVTSPFAFTATRALRLTDDSGNSNFFKDSATSSLKLGAGSTPTLTLPEAGGASLDGKLTIDLAGDGIGLQINNGAISTEFGAENGSAFHFKTGLPVFWFQKGISVNGNIHTYDRDTIIGPSSNLDTYLKIASGADDSIHAKADKFAILGDEYWMETRFSSGQVDLVTSANKFKMNKALEVDGALQVTSAITTSGSLDVGGNITASGSLSVTGDLMTSGWIGRNAHHTGGLVGGYNNIGFSEYKSNPIYAIGSAYLPGDSDLEDMYGIGYSNHHASFITGTTSGWGLYVAADGQARNFLNGSGGVSYLNRNGGSVGIGTDSPSYTLHVMGVSHNNHSYPFGVESPQGLFQVGIHGGVVYFDQRSYNTWKTQAHFGHDGVWRSSSDRRIKKNINDYDDVLERVMKLRVRSYDFIRSQSNESEELGVIAQEVQPLFPELVSEPPDGMPLNVQTGAGGLSVSHSKFGVVAVKAIQELRAEKDAEIESLRDENKALKTAMDNLISRLELIEGELANRTEQ